MTSQIQADAENAQPDQPLQARVPMELGGSRLDKVIAELFPQYSRSRLQGWLKEERVLVNGVAAAKGNQKVQGMDRIELSPGVLAHMQALIPEDMNLDIVARTNEYTVVNKQAGLVVHPAPGHWTGTLMNGLYHLDPGLIHVPRAGIVHRLDADTTGLMVVARTAETQVKLVQMLQARIVKRVYLAMVWGRIANPLTVNNPLGRDPRNRLRMAVVDHGKPAVTHFTPVAFGELLEVPVTLMVCRLETGVPIKFVCMPSMPVLLWWPTRFTKSKALAVTLPCDFPRLNCPMARSSSAKPCMQHT
jgi:23S rRNA pseudouridine1911/1915/1917 synthase